jgi:hypothetical protein
LFALAGAVAAGGGKRRFASVLQKSFQAEVKPEEKKSGTDNGFYVDQCPNG